MRADSLDGLVYSRRWTSTGKGLLPIPEQINRNISIEGLWREPPEYANIASNRLFGYISTLTDIGEYRILEDYPKLLHRDMGRFRMVFPNQKGAAFGDTSYSPIRNARGIISSYKRVVELGRPQAELDAHRHAVKWVIDKGLASPLSSSEMQLLPMNPDPLLTRTDYITFPHLFMQRNGALDKDNGMMSTVYGSADYSHSQIEGINFELYAKGTKILPHNGYGGFASKSLFSI